MEHFTRKGHNIMDIKVTGIEKVKINSRIDRRTRESTWIHRMDALINGDNSRE